MALENKPDIARLKPQALALLKGFMDAGARGLTTKQLLNFEYLEETVDHQFVRKQVGDWRSRKSELKKMGYVFKKTKIEGHDQFCYVLVGFVNDPQLALIP